MLDHQTRLSLCQLVRTRFRGRKTLEVEAQSGSELALAELEVRLGLADEARLDETRLWVAARRWRGSPELIGYLLCPDDHRARRAMAARRYATAEEPERLLASPRVVIARALAPDECLDIDAKRAERARRRELRDKLAKRPPRYAERAIIKQRAREAYDRAKLRAATHDHTIAIKIVEPGDEGARSSTHQVRPGTVGLPAAYARKGYWVTTSEHVIRASRAILDPVVQALTELGYLYLTRDVRVRNGRGTTLVVERRTERGAWR
jgi:hypothetical protein